MVYQIVAVIFWTYLLISNSKPDKIIGGKIHTQKSFQNFTIEQPWGLFILQLQTSFPWRVHWFSFQDEQTIASLRRLVMAVKLFCRILQRSLYQLLIHLGSFICMLSKLPCFY